MTEVLKGKTLAEARGAVQRNSTREVTGGERGRAAGGACEDDVERLEPLTGVKAYPARVKCATLPWHAFEAALKSGARRHGQDGVADDADDRRPRLLRFRPRAAAGRATEVERPEGGEDDPALMGPVLEALKTVRDPEIPVNLVDLGLIYELIVKKGGIVYVEMT